jgi:glycogen operon protein
MPLWTVTEGSPYPLGVTAVPGEAAYNFALYSKHATGVTLELYRQGDPGTPIHTTALDPLRNKSARVWHCRVAASVVEQAHYYAYRVAGPFDPSQGHRFDRDKVLLDPYARAVVFPPGHSREAASQPGDNAGRAPLGVLRPEPLPFDWGDDRPPRHGHDTVIYELHVRGFTRRENSGVAPERRGTFAGVVDKIPYLQELGVTVVELMPVFQFDPAEGNYWGYMTLNFFAPHHLYAVSPEPGAAISEFKAMVRALHQAGIEVVLDVVYNHTTENNANGPNYGFRGIDNTTYYLLEDDRSRYRNDAGTGNVLHTANRYVRAFVLDSLRYWVQEMHVDGFRFDLASIFTRGSDGSINLEDPPIVSAIRSDPVLADVRLIAEAWDISAYQLGRSFPGITWLQWNGKFRDEVRSIVKSDPGQVGALATRLYGSADLFPDDLENAYHAFQSVNFITAHDGFTLYDLVSYNEKHNAGSDGGTDDNRSWNCGWEGDAGVPGAVVDLRRRQIKNFCCLVMLANGTPMVVAGDELAHTQGGNNNPYNLDNETTWLDWSRRQPYGDVFRFFQRMIAFRTAHPTLGRSRFWRAAVRWAGVDGDPDWSYLSRSLACYLDGSELGDVDLYVMINAYWEPLEFTVQEGAAGEWRRVVDTARVSPQDIAEPGDEVLLLDLRYTVAPRAVVVLMRR